MDFFTMSSDAAGTYNYIITECAMLVNRVQLAPSLSMAHMRMLQEKNSVYTCRHIQTYLTTISQGSWSFQWNDALTGNIPVAIIFGFVKSEAIAGREGNTKLYYNHIGFLMLFAGSLSENPYNFVNLNMQDVTVKVGSRRLPAYDLKFQPNIKDTQLGLFELFNALGEKNPPKILNRATYSGGCFLLGIDLSRSGSPLDQMVNTDFDATSLSLAGNFNQATTASYTSTH